MAGLLIMAVVALPASAHPNHPGDGMRTVEITPIPYTTHPLHPVPLPEPLQLPATPPVGFDPSALHVLSGGDAANLPDASSDPAAPDVTADDGQLQAAAFATTCLTPTINQKVLVIDAVGGPSEADVTAITTALEYVGVPYTLYTASKTPGGLTDTMLASGCVGQYSGIITSTGDLSYSPSGNAAGPFQSALTPTEWQTLWTYAALFGVRQVSWYTFPNSQYGFSNAAPVAIDTSSAPLASTLSSRGTGVFTYINAANPIQITNAFTYQTSALDSTVVPLLTDAAGHALIVSYVHPADGRETLALTFDSNQFLTHEVVLSYGLINWVTKGLFLGERHVFATPQEDDIFISGTEWNTRGVPTTVGTTTAISEAGTVATYTVANSLLVGSTVNITGAIPAGYNVTGGTVTAASATSFSLTRASGLAVATTQGTVTVPTLPPTLPLTTLATPPVACTTAVDAAALPDYRVNGTDFTSLVAWQNTRQLQAQFANFRVTHAFNAAGAYQPGLQPAGANSDGTQPVGDTLLPAVIANQALFNWVTHTWDHEYLDAPTAVNPTYMGKSGWTPLELTPNDVFATGLAHFTNYSNKSLVTPNISGLTTAATMNEAYTYGVRYVVSDTSFVGPPSGANPTPNAGIYNAVHPGILEIPRRPTNMYYNVTTPGEWLAEDNCLYPPTAAYTTPAHPTAGVFGSVTTYAALLDRVSNDLLPYMLTGEMDPWMFHQDNLRAYDGVHSIYSDLMDALFAKYAAHYNLPVQSDTQDALGVKFADRMAYNAAGITASVTGTTLSITAQKAATVAVTGLKNATSEVYGGQNIAHVQLAAGQTVTTSVATLTVRTDSQTRAYGQPNPVLTGSVTGVVPGDNITLSSFTTTATSTSPPGVYPITATLSDPNNKLGAYIVTNIVGALTVTQAPLLVSVNLNPSTPTLNVSTRVYGQPNPALNATNVTFTGFAPNENASFLNLSTLTFSGLPAVDGAAGAYPVTAGGLLSGGGTTPTCGTAGPPATPVCASYNYTFAFVPGTLTGPGTFTVTKAPLTATMVDQTRVYGAANPVFIPTLAGLLPGDVGKLTSTYGSTATVASPVGVYPMLPQLVDIAPWTVSGNYTVAANNANLTITKAPLSISAADQTRTYGLANPVLTGTLVGLLNGDALTGSYSTIAGPTSPVGTYPIVPAVVDSSPSTLGNYTAPLANPATLTITNAPLLIT
ncbi:MAG: hypothetical protein M3069_09660, partial [Chloroflexota bacterium]|nr:hypothetical protein [Chloroflexota bacterium]